MEHDASDILGQNTMPSPSGNRIGLFSLSTTQSIYTAIALGGFLFLGLRLWKRIMFWRERSYKLATRRRHGIPDTDLRPFNVAYSEAMTMRAREEDNQRHPKSRPAPRPQPSFVDLRESSQEENVLRNRSGIPQRPDTVRRSTAVPVPGGYYPTPLDPSHLRIGSVINETHLYVDQTGKETNSQFTHAPSPTKKAGGLTRHGGFLNVDEADDSEDKKRSFEEDIDEGHESKKTRVDGDELMDDDDDAEFEEEEEVPKRGSKRGLREDVDESLAKAARGKRARKVSAEKPLHPDSSMDVDFDDEEADEVPELSPVRGKKRDRAEAGSTFGGDDDDEDEQESAKASRRRTKRRTVAKRKSETGVLRGKKRDRAGSAEASEASGSSPDKRSSRAKRGKRTSNGVHHHRDHQDDRAARSDVSMDESTTSNRSKVRSVGDEWESNGVKYKIGPNYQRLRQALVKKARQKFLMPKDSQHPDRSENLQVCIETWLTEEEYQEAKKQHMLAWQDDSPKRGTPEHGDKLTIDVSQANGVSHQGGANVPGKSLLWGTSTTTTPTMSPAPPSPTSEAGTMALDKTHTHTLAQTPAKEHRYGRHSLAGSALGLPAATFASQIPTAKRIASASRTWNIGSSGSFEGADGLGASSSGALTPGMASPTVGLSDSTNVNGVNGTASGSALAMSVAVGSPRASPVKVFSKWEKQELEARAMMKIREANRRKEMERDAKVKEEREAREKVERERAERERMEREARERVEKERAARAEAERKVREEEEKRKAAAAASVAAATTAPAPAGTSSLASAPPLGSQPTLSGAAPASTTTAPAAGGSGGFSFFPPGAAASSSAPTTTSAAAASPFGAPKPPATASTPANPFGLPTNGAGATTESKAASAFSFGPPTTTTRTAGSTAPKAGGFSFGPSEPKKEESSTASTMNGGGASLLSRLGATAPATTTNEPAKPASNPTFSFNTVKPDVGASASSSNLFGAPAPAAASSSSSSTGATTTPKFNFGFGGKTTTAPTTSTTSTSTPAAPSSLSGALGSDGAKNPFGTFKTPGLPTSGNGAASGTTSNGGVPAPKFSFGTAGGASGTGASAFGVPSSNTSSPTPSNVFGGNGATNAFGSASSSNVFGSGSSTNAFSVGAGKEPVKSAFGNIGGGATSVFGSTSGMGTQAGAATPSPSPFGALASSSSNAFSGAGATAGKEEPKKPMFSFNTSAASSGSSATTTPAAPAAGGPAKFSFNFGTGSTPAAASPSSFGAAPGGSGGSVFSGGVFGSAGTNQQK